MFKLRDLNHPMALAAALVVVGLGMLAPGPKDVIGNILKAQFGVHEDTPWWVGLILIVLGILMSMIVYFWPGSKLPVVAPITAEPDVDVTPPRQASDRANRPVKMPSAIAFKIDSPTGGQRIFPLEVGKQITIGRAPDNDLVLHPDDRTVSRHHCIATVFGDHVDVEDLGATNILMINGIEMHKGTVRMRERLELGETALTLIPYVER
jgi:hypothetical protein